MTVTLTNGPTRKTLASQLDRLDAILDALSDGLNEAVASAVKEAAGAAVQEAVRQALIEVLTNPDVLSLIGSAARAHVAHPSTEDVNASDTDRRPGLRERVSALGEWAGGQVRAARAACARAAAAGCRCLGGLGARLAPLWRLRKHLLVALGLGAAAGVAAYAAGPWLSALISGVATAASTMFVEVRLRLQRLLAGEAFSSTTS